MASGVMNRCRMDTVKADWRWRRQTKVPIVPSQTQPTRAPWPVPRQGPGLRRRYPGRRLVVESRPGDLSGPQLLDAVHGAILQ